MRLRPIAEHAFLTSLILILIAVIAGIALFYKYEVLAKKSAPEIKEPPFQFKKDLYQKVLSEWQNREERFESAVGKEYPNLFE